MNIFGIKDDYADTRCEYGDLISFITWDNCLPKKMDLKKYLDSEISYNNTYYFSSEELAKKFENKLWDKYHKEEKELHFESYSELMQYIDNEGFGKTKEILNYDNFAVVKIGEQYFYYEQGENDCDEFCEVELVARLDYNTQNDLKVNGENMHELFDCLCCGETNIGENGEISYLWFKEKGE